MWKLVRDAALGATCLITYMTFSAGMINYNKFLLGPDRFPFAVLLTALHMTTGFVFSTVALWLVPPTRGHSVASILCGSSATQTLRRGAAPGPSAALLGQVLVISCCSAATVVASTSALKYADVAFVQMCREPGVLFVYTFSVVTGTETLGWRYVLVLTCVALCAVLGVSGAATFSWIGLRLQLVANLSNALQVSFSARVMTGARSLDPLVLLNLSTPLTLLFVLPFACLFWSPVIMVRFAVWWPHVIGNMAVALALQVSTLFAVWAATSTGFSLGAILKDVLAITFAAVLLHESLRAVQVVAFVGIIVGTTMFWFLRLLDRRAAEKLGEASGPSCRAASPSSSSAAAA